MTWPTPPSRTSRPGRRGLTLLEMVVSLSLASVLMLGMMSAIMLVTRGIPDPQSTTRALSRTQDALDQFADEVRYALHFTERSAAAVAFTIPDRDGDGSPEHIRYAWSGAAGDPLTRSYNRGPAVPVVEEVARWHLAYDLVSTTQTYPGPRDELPEVVLSAHAPQTPAQLHAEQATETRWLGQLVVLDPPEGAESWRPTRLSLAWTMMGLFNSDTLVQLHEVTPGPPGSPGLPGPPGSLVAPVQTLASRLLLNIWTTTTLDFNHADHLNLPIDRPYALVMRPAGNRPAAELRFSAGTGGKLLSTSGGSTWTGSPDHTLHHALRGRYAVRRPDQHIVRHYVAGVRVALDLAAGSAPAARTAVQTVNAPQVLSAFWHADFSALPTVLDSNGDGQPDWVTRSGAALPAADVVHGTLVTTQTLDSRPLHGFNEPVTIHARVRSTIAGNVATLWINADWSGNQAAPLYLTLGRQADGSQELRIHRKATGSASKLLQAVPGLPGDFVDLHMLIDPARDTFNVAVNAEQVETFRYERLGLDASERFVTLASEPGVIWDEVAIRVGGTSP